MQTNKQINKEGIGLGLYITKSLAVSLGGTIEVFSEVEQFTSFVVTVPVTRNLKAALDKGEVKLNYEFAKK